MLTCTVALHCAHTHIHTTCMKCDRDYLSFHTQLKFSLCKPHAECLIQKKIHYCTVAFAACEQLGLSRESTIFCRLCSYADLCGTGIQTQLDQPLTLVYVLLCVRGAADGRGLRMTCISRNQTPLPLAIMLMTMRQWRYSMPLCLYLHGDPATEKEIIFPQYPCQVT